MVGLDFSEVIWTWKVFANTWKIFRDFSKIIRLSHGYLYNKQTESEGGV